MRKLAAGLALAWQLAACGGEPEPPPIRDALFELRLDERPAESAPPGLLGGGRPDFRTIGEDIALLTADPDAKGLFVRVGSFGGAWGARYDLAQVLAMYRAGGKPVHCHFTDTDNVGYALMASSCDRISMTPAGTLNLVGPALQVLHGHQLLESLGVRAEMMQVGKYKGAAEPFTRDDMSAPLAESLNQVLDDLAADLAAALEDRAKADGNPVDAGPYTPQQALKAGLVDGVDYDDAAREKARQAAGAAHVHRMYEPKGEQSLDFATLWKAFTGDPGADAPQGDRLAYVVLSGEIIDGTSPALDRVVADPVISQLRSLADDTQVKAVVLRIDSPGGSALASDRIWHAVRRVAGRKPVAVSVGDMAASGGYYIASAADRIFAAPTSLVGSIGVVGGKVSFGDLAEEHGVHATTLTRGPQAAWMSALTPFDEGERARLSDMLQRTYDLFLRRVSLGREMPVEEVRAMAEGRLMTGARGETGKLVDQLGSLHEALAWAREQASLPDDAPVETWPGEAEMLAGFAHMFSGVQAPQSAAELRARMAESALQRAVPSWLQRLTEGPHVATALPIQLHVR